MFFLHKIRLRFPVFNSRLSRWLARSYAFEYNNENMRFLCFLLANQVVYISRSNVKSLTKIDSLPTYPPTLRAILGPQRSINTPAGNLMPHKQNNEIVNTKFKRASCAGHLGNFSSSTNPVPPFT